MALLEVLDRHGVKYDKEEAKERLDLVLKGLRRDPAFESELAEFKTKKPQKGGGDYDIPIPVKMTTGDFLGSELRWFVNVMGSPYAQVVVKLLFMVLFFLSYLENIPVVGSILSAVLDVMLAGGRILIKTVQKALPPVIGLIPLPYMSMLGIVLASVFGMLVWQSFRLVARTLHRQLNRTFALYLLRWEMHWQMRSWTPIEPSTNSTRSARNSQKTLLEVYKL
jgi:hypothetical protein